MGYAASFTYSGPAAIFREHAALTAYENDGARRLNLAELAPLGDAKYDAMEPGAGAATASRSPPAKRD